MKQSWTSSRRARARLKTRVDFAGADILAATTVLYGLRSTANRMLCDYLHRTAWHSLWCALLMTATVTDIDLTTIKRHSDASMHNVRIQIRASA